MEQWNAIYINEEKTKYEISSHGRCRNIEKLHWKTQGILKPKINKKSGYVQYCVVHNKINYYKYAHRLVAEFFIEGNTELHVNHKDGNKLNNYIENLEWVTHTENMRHCFDNGLTTVNKPIKQYTLGGEFIREFSSASEAERSLGFKGRSINNALTSRHEQAHGFQWRFVNDVREVKNIAHQVKLQNIKIVQLTKSGEFIQEFDKVTDAYKKLNKKDNGVISQVCKGNRKSFAGYKWMYSVDYYADKDIV